MRSSAAHSFLCRPPPHLAHLLGPRTAATGLTTASRPHLSEARAATHRQPERSPPRRSPRTPSPWQARSMSLATEPRSPSLPSSPAHPRFPVRERSATTLTYPDVPRQLALTRWGKYATGTRRFSLCASVKPSSLTCCDARASQSLSDLSRPSPCSTSTTAKCGNSQQPPSSRLYRSMHDSRCGPRHPTTPGLNLQTTRTGASSACLYSCASAASDSYGPDRSRKKTSSPCSALSCSTRTSLHAPPDGSRCFPVAMGICAGALVVVVVLAVLCTQVLEERGKERVAGRQGRSRPGDRGFELFGYVTSRGNWRWGAKAMPCRLPSRKNFFQPVNAPWLLHSRFSDESVGSW